MAHDSDVKMTPAACYEASRARDARFDGVFFMGVKTTGIYCRPVCPARTPKEASCVFFGTAAAAESAGFRACLRCRPELAPGRPGQSLAEAVLRRLQESAVEGTRIGDLEDELGLGARQVRRLLKETFGINAVQAMQTQRLLLARQLLEQTAQPISEVALAAGFRSLRRFNAVFKERHACDPSGWRRSQRPNHEDGEIHLRLSYRPPLAWEALMDYFRSRLVPGVEEIVGQEYRRTVRLGGEAGWLRVWPEDGRAVLNVAVAPSLSRRLGAVQTRLRRMFDLDAQPVAIAEALGEDPLLAEVMRRHPGLRVGGAWDAFELAVRAVLGQQITVAAATTLSGRLTKSLGEAVVTPFANLHHLAVTAETLADAGVDELCRLGLVSARAAALRHLAEWSLRGGFKFPVGSDHDAVVQRLVELPGIGPWTAHYIAMRALRYPDAFPAADLGLRKAVGGSEMASAKETERRAEAWRPWRAYAAIALWKSLG
ncbi:MAG TPA: AlkA N-terminal domain-containing protein [Prosthecobacter sp.]|nr:AlkA N-terminal domain-containing protein [Prosthecobacter sp.]